MIAKKVMKIQLFTTYLSYFITNSCLCEGNKTESFILNYDQKVTFLGQHFIERF